jgi:hypothetical protein
MVVQLSQNTRLGGKFSIPNRLFREWHFRPIQHFTLVSPFRFVILSKRSLRSEGSGRAARCVAFFATQ